MRVIHRQSKEMADIITDVRVLIDSLQDTYTLEARNLADVIDSEATKVQELTADDIEFETNVSDDTAVMADELLPRVFRNLFSNAIDHNDKQIPRITVSATASDNTVTVRVTDNGPGMPPAMQERLFKRSHRADHGLGLYLVRELLERYGGDIDLVETGPEGTTFEILLHRATDEQATEAGTPPSIGPLSLRSSTPLKNDESSERFLYRPNRGWNSSSAKRLNQSTR